MANVAERARRLAAGATALALGIMVMSGSGCYRRIVGARGIGAAGVQTQEPTPPTLLDRLFGPEPQQGDSQPRMRVN